MTRDGEFGQLKNDGSSKADCLCPDYDHTVPQAGQRIVCNGVWKNQYTQEVHQIAGQGMKLDPDFISFETQVRQTRPFDSEYTFLDILLFCSALAVKLKFTLI